jgi:hypothetical protein
MIQWHLARVEFTLDLILVRVTCHSEEDVQFTKPPYQSQGVHVPMPHVTWASNK